MCETSRYDYELPADLIAQQPLARRSDARLLVVDRKEQRIDHLHVRDLPELLSPLDSLVLNDTRVIPARLLGYRKRTGGKWEGLFLSQDTQGHWQILCKTRGKLEAGETIVLRDANSLDCCELRLLVKLEQGRWACRPVHNEPALELLERAGRVPLPPYIRQGEMLPADRQSYQTVYAQTPGAIAAPTAGLHFTTELLARIAGRGISLQRVTLHVGIGTFRPVAASHLSQHQMHAEWGCISETTVTELLARRAAGGRVLAVGTTSMRVLETAAHSGTLTAWSGETDLFIRPPYEFRVVDALLTNFHLPRSTLLVLVRCFGGDELIRRAYQAAIQQRYRFYSYGDAMLIV